MTTSDYDTFAAACSRENASSLHNHFDVTRYSEEFTFGGSRRS